MKLIELIKKNIKAADFKYGKSVKGKGLEIFLPDINILFRHRDYSLENKFFTKEEAAEKANLVFSKVEKESSKFYIKFDFNEKKFNIDSEEKLTSMLTKHSSFSLYEKAKKIGYIKVSSYDKSYTSQCQLVKDLTKLDGYDTYEEIVDGNYDTFDGAREVEGSEYSNYYLMGDGYELLTGNDLVWKNHEDATHIDTRLDYYDEVTVDDFWYLDGIEELKNNLKEVDPDGDVTVYHRKGKDFYVTPTLETKECNLLHFLEDYKYEKEDCEEDYIAFLCSKSGIDTKIDTIASIIKSKKREIEIESYLSITLNEFDNNLIAKKYEYELEEFKFDVINYIDWKSEINVEAVVDNAIEKLLIDNLISKKLFGKYTHLQKLEELTLKDGKKLVYTKVSEFENNKSYAISFKNEEYHFSLSELYNTTPKAFYMKISNALTKRILEKINQSILIKKAKKVFVGLEDSYNSGNCKFGTSSFCSQHNIDTKKIGGIRGDVLLEMDYSSFTKRAVMSAIAKSVA